jgi:GT2 family glycosyltransferase
LRQPASRAAGSSVETLAIIVNYKAAELALGAVQSVLESTSLGPVRVALVDNSEDPAEAQILGAKLPPGVELLVNPRNTGFGRACNQAFARYPSDFVLLLNPDARLLPECLIRMQRTLLFHDQVAAVSPQVFWDEKRQFLLPPSYPPALMVLEEMAAGGGSSGAALINILSHIWRRYAVRVWRAERAIRVSNLSGGLVLLRSEPISRVGGLFDPSFFLYFEDTDLFHRLRKARHTFLVDPMAEGIHYYNQCDRDSPEWKYSCMAESRRMFIEKQYRGWHGAARIVSGLCRIASQRGDDALPEPEFTAPFVLDVPEVLSGGWLFEFSPNPSLLPAAGRFGKGRVMDFSEEYWGMLAKGRYFCRIGSPWGLGLKAKRFSWEVKA